MHISIGCQCGKSIDFDEYVMLYGETYTPYEIACSCCGAVASLNIHLDFVKDGDPNKKFPDDDPDFVQEASEGYLGGGQ